MSINNFEREADWAALRAELGDLRADETVNALKELYSLYDADMLRWLAGLYDHRIGGWYYSSSARDSDTVERLGKTYKLLPDVESTVQALAFMENAGLTGRGNSYADVLPDNIKARIGQFVYSLQNEDGYFYHPQWGKDITNSRQGRDLGSALRILRALGIKPKYTPPTAEKKTDREAYDLSRAPERFRSKENYLEYLHGMDMANRSYNNGNELLSQTSQIIAYSELVGADLVELTVEWLNSLQHPETGMWHGELSYYGVNGIHKLTQLYNGLSREFPNGEAAFESAVAIIFSDIPVGAAVDVYNPWHVLGAIIQNIKKYGKNGEARAENLIKSIRRRAPEAIRRSMEKISAFKKPDGAFSYSPGHPAVVSQSAPVTVPYIPEGDVNGNCISSTALVLSIYQGLDAYNVAVPIFTETDGAIFIEMLSDLAAESEITE